MNSLQVSFHKHLKPLYYQYILIFGGHCLKDYFIIINFQMRPIQIRLVGRFRFVGKVTGCHQHLLYRGIHSQTSEPLFMKGEQYKTKPTENYITILQEGKILQVMQGGIGIPHMHWCGQEEDYNFIVLEELDRSFETLLALCGGKYSLKTILMLGQEIVSILQYFHFKNFTHNQLMPRNFMLGPGEKQGKLFLVDYGAASRFKDSQTLQHIRDQRRVDPRSINLEFSSVRYNRGEAVSRRDDMESLLYMLLYLAKGTLPWSEIANNLKKAEGQRARSVLKIKQQISQQTLFQGYPQLLLMFRYTKGLAFDEKPRYIYYKNVMKQKIEKLGLIDDHIYDWMLVEEPQPLEDPEIYFDVIPNEAEFIRQISEELKLKEKAEIQREQQRKPEVTDVRSPRGKDKEKECEIY